MRLGYWTYGYERHPIEECLSQVAAIGYQGVELCTQENYATPIETLDDRRLVEIAHLLAEHRLEAVAVDAQWGLAAADPSDRQKRWDRFQRSVGAAVTLGASIVELSAGGVPDGWERARAWDLALDTARQLVDLARSSGVILALEAHVGAIVEGPEEAIRFLRDIGDPALRLNLDLVHPFVLGYDLETIVNLLAPHAVFAHVSDAHGRYPDHVFSTPGEGDVDWPAYLKLLKQAGYDGYLMVQIPGARRRLPAYEPFAEAKRAYVTLTKALDLATRAADS